MLFFTLIAFAFAACNNNPCKPAPDVSEIESNVQLNRFDQDLFELSTQNPDTVALAALREKYPNFADFYFELLGFKNPGEPDDSLLNRLQGFASYPQVKATYDTVQTVYGDISDIEADLSEAFKYFKHYFPERELPKLITMYSEFSYGIMIPPYGNNCVVSLEAFFGADYDLYYSPQINLPRYITRTLNRDHIASKILYATIEDMVEDSAAAATNLLDYMILNGKKLFILDKLMPCTHDSLKLGYSATQTEWVKNNEFEMWKEVLSSKLYNIDYKAFQKYVSLSPNSPDMPAEAPGNTGSYIGFKIVEAFMKRNPNYSFEQLIALQDSKQILVQSKYKPR
ncbi:MAG: hypothetical protein ACPG19_09360 [Saprospiraceae bacterium]